MRAKLEQRLQELRSEYNAGQKALMEIETKQIKLRETLLRISGAIQVLEEELKSPDPAPESMAAAVAAVEAEN
jgi:predicted nuclease with TOPRIM domain